LVSGRHCPHSYVAQAFSFCLVGLRAGVVDVVAATLSQQLLLRYFGVLREDGLRPQVVAKKLLGLLLRRRFSANRGSMLGWDQQGPFDRSIKVQAASASLNTLSSSIPLSAFATNASDSLCASNSLYIFLQLNGAPSPPVAPSCRVVDVVAAALSHQLLMQLFGILRENAALPPPDTRRVRVWEAWLMTTGLGVFLHGQFELSCVKSSPGSQMTVKTFVALNPD